MSNKIKVENDGKGKHQSFTATVEDFQSEADGHYQVDLTAYGSTDEEARSNLIGIIERLSEELRALLAAPALHPLQQCLRDNGDLIAAQAIIAQQAQMIEHLKAATAVERQEPFMYGIMQPDGKPHYSELCVSGEASDLESEVESMNEGEELGYRVVALYTEQPAPVAVVLPEHEDHSERESPNSWTDWAIGWNACLDKVKELNP